MGTINAISLWQPWATLIAIGAKTIETRPRRTSVTGRIAIHAAKKWDDENRHVAFGRVFREALLAGGDYEPDAQPVADCPAHCMPLGAIVATCRLRYAVQIPRDLDNPGVEAEVFTGCKCGHIRDAHAGQDHAGVCRVPVRWQHWMTPKDQRVVTNTFDGHTACCACPGYRRRFDDRERAFGNYTAGRWAWILADVRPLPEPIPYAGKQGWMHVDEALLAGGVHGHV